MDEEKWNLVGKRALVCGSSQGIGKACAHELADRGASVTLTARDATALAEVHESLNGGFGAAHRWFTSDFTDPVSLRRLAEEQIELHGGFDVLVNNTGGPPPGPLTEAGAEDFQRAITMHLLCNQTLVQTLIPDMKRAGFGRVINIISISVKEPIPGLGVSNTTRWAVASWAKTLAGELGPHGITVNNVLPGYTDTERLRSLFDRWARERSQSAPELEKEMVARVPAGRLGLPEEVAAAVGFLASPAAAYINGINLPVDGGRSGCL